MSQPPRFRYFVVLAEMRTGSNLLEACLNEFPGVACEGEAFNPVFVGHPKTESLYGFDRAARDADPLALLAAFGNQPGLAGFRYFHDHDQRVIDPILNDPDCAKIVLTRNPLDSYVSLKIARATQQWRLGDVKNRKAEKVVFDPVEFETHVRMLQEFQLKVQSALQTSGQTAFYVDYEDIQSLDVLNGMAQWLGVTARIDALPKKLKRQNPEPLDEKLVNPEAVAQGLARLDRFHLSRSPSFEPRQPGLIWAYHACRSLPLVYAPLPGCSERAILNWMASIDGAAPRDLHSDFSAQDWRAWQRNHPQRVSFTVMRHPLARAHEIFVGQVALGKRENVRSFIERVHGIALPTDADGLRAMDRDAHRRAFLGFLQFVQANLNGQTALPTRPVWASQTRLIEGITSQCPLHHLLRETHLAEDLPRMGRDLGRELPPFSAKPHARPVALEDIYDAQVEAAGRAAYGIDYNQLGFGDWSAQ
ncbi:MAG: nodulation protein NodH [Natronohydrobacter sp.]|nr:nodulation protein NodH [Natronohydrobacter sp.]